MSDFNDRPFVAGSLIGLRAFDLDSLGRLCGPTYPFTFKPGENLASCRSGFLPSVFGAPLPPFRPNRNTPSHQVGGAKCGCGFYAYFDGKNDYHKRGAKVAAVVEGYGVCTVGERGFRAEKMRALAFIHHNMWKRSTWVGAIGWMLACCYSVAHALTRSNWGSFASAVIGLCAWAAVIGWHLWDVRPGSTLWHLRRNYPDVPIYRTQRRALRKHPLSGDASTAPPKPSPTDDDFWTRSA